MPIDVEHNIPILIEQAVDNCQKNGKYNWYE